MSGIFSSLLTFAILTLAVGCIFLLYLWWQNRVETKKTSAEKPQTPSKANTNSQSKDLIIQGSEEIRIPLSGSRFIRMTIEETDAPSEPDNDPVSVEIKIKARSGDSWLERAWNWLKEQVLLLIRLAKDQINHPKYSTVFILGLIIVLYLFTRFTGITEYPIYFFSDEAVQTNQAALLLENGFKGHDDVFLPTYLRNGERFNLSASVYVQVLPTIIFGKSITVTRGTSILITALALIYLCLTLKKHFKFKYWWLGGLLLSIAPAWFLHSRTAFETTLALTAFTAFIYYYLDYRLHEPKQLYKALFFGAATFYAYNPGRILIVAMGLALLALDARYHWKNRQVAWRAAIFLLFLALPFLRFQFTNPEENANHMRSLGSYWMQPIPMIEKLQQFGQEYLSGLDPRYWYLANPHDLPRHQMGDYPHILTILLPFFLIGAVVLLFRLKKPAYRFLLAALLIAPLGGALVDIGITRCLAFLVPATTLSVIGLEWCIERIPEKFTWKKAVPVLLFLLAGVYNIYLMDQALTDGKYWSTNYGMGGMQYGAEVLMETLDEMTEEYPDKLFMVTPSWANGPDEIARFWFGNDIPFNFGSIEGYINNHFENTGEIIFMSVPEEFSRVLESGKFQNIDIINTIPYPDGSTGFYFYTLEYVKQY